jgi:hypothetical protein
VRPPVNRYFVLLVLFWLLPHARATAQDVRLPTEDDYYPMVTFPAPAEVVLEIGGMDWLDRDRTRLAVCTRLGEVWVIDNVYARQPVLKKRQSEGSQQGLKRAGDQVLRFKRMLLGLHEPLGMLVDPGHGYPDGVYVAQRSELTRLDDTDGDDRIDVVETFCDDWEINGSYHEYAFGPKLGPDGQLWVTLNRPFSGGKEAAAYWRGWAVKVDQRGKMTPICTGVRSPSGFANSIDDEMFYTDNQGDYVATGKLAHLRPGAFHGNPAGLNSLHLPGANFTLPFEGYPKLGMKWAEAVKVNPFTTKRTTR